MSRAVGTHDYSLRELGRLGGGTEVVLGPNVCGGLREHGFHFRHGLLRHHNRVHRLEVDREVIVPEVLEHVCQGRGVYSEEGRKAGMCWGLEVVPSMYACVKQR